MQLNCAHCGYSWNYGGTGEYYATCPKCVPGDTVVGGIYTCISAVHMNDELLGADGWCKVSRLLSHEYLGHLVEIEGAGLLNFSVTPEHLLFVSHRVDGKLQRPHWMQAGRLVCQNDTPNRTDYLFLPTTCNHDRAMDEDLMDDPSNPEHESTFSEPDLRKGGLDTTSMGALLGRKIAEWWGEYQGKNHESMVEQNINRLDTVDGGTVLQLKQSDKARSSSGKVHHQRESSSFMDDEFRSAIHFILHSGYTLRSAFLQGLLSSIPQIQEVKTTYLVLPTTTFAMQTQFLFASVGRFTSIKMIELSETSSNHYGQTVSLPVLSFTDDLAIKTRRGFWVPVVSLKIKRFSGLVYNLETTDSTYTVSNVLVHNCLYKVKIPRKEKREQGRSKERAK